MGDLNQVTLIGRLGRDPEVRTFDNGSKVANLRIATSDQWKDRDTGEKREQTEWHSIAVFGPLVDTVEKYLKKGARVAVQGALRTRKWQDQSGADRYSTEVVLQGFKSHLQIIDWPDSDNREQSQRDAYGSLPGNQDNYGSDYPPADDEIPF
jgi:single-strand DNA-binding protein